MRLWLGVGVLVAVACVLVLPAASYLQGVVIPVDGGLTIQTT